ncbi:hypothetical protein D3C80_1486890 [compost metagenome]
MHHTGRLIFAAIAGVAAPREKAASDRSGLNAGPLGATTKQAAEQTEQAASTAAGVVDLEDVIQHVVDKGVANLLQAVGQNVCRTGALDEAVNHASRNILGGFHCLFSTLAYLILLFGKPLGLDDRICIPCR